MRRPIRSGATLLIVASLLLTACSARPAFGMAVSKGSFLLVSRKCQELPVRRIWIGSAGNDGVPGTDDDDRTWTATARTGRYSLTKLELTASNLDDFTVEGRLPSVNSDRAFSIFVEYAKKARIHHYFDVTPNRLTAGRVKSDTYSNFREFCS